MKLDKIFPDEESKNEAIEHFKSLKDNIDWVFLVEKLIKYDIEDITNDILSPDKEWKEGEEKEQKRIRAYWIILSELPDELIKALSSNHNDIFQDSDPYYKDVKQMTDSTK